MTLRDGNIFHQSLGKNYMVNINVTIEDAGLKALIERLKIRLTNMTPVMKEIGQIVRNSVIKNFQQGGRPQWKSLSPVTLGLSWKLKGKQTHVKSGKRETKAFERYKSGKKILIDTARLMKSITSKGFRDRAEVGTNVIYGAIHQLGGQAGRGLKVTIPARPYLMVQDEDWAEIRKVVENYLVRQR